MDKRSLWWTAVVLIVLDAIARAMDNPGAVPTGGSLIRFALGAAFLVWFVALVNEERRWPLVVLIVLDAVWLPASIGWIMSADESGRVIQDGVAYPVAIWWVSCVAAVFGLVAFTWHYRQYRRTVWIHKSRSES